MNRTLPSLLSVLLLGGACGTQPPDEEPTPDPRLTDQSCLQTGDTRCSTDTFQTCDRGYWRNEQQCAAVQVCDPDLGCVECDPFFPTLCVEDNVHACDADGRIGAWQRTCAEETCFNGGCEESDCVGGTDLIYVVDSAYRLLSFDPRNDAFVFSLLGDLSCPAGSSWPGWGSGTATPFSMSVDRTGRAWILYSSGQVFWVPINNVSQCSESNWVPGDSGFELFGMGFVSNAESSDQETLYIAGGTVAVMQANGTGTLGAVDPKGSGVVPIGMLSPSELGPELTGTGAAELWAYFPGELQARVAMLDQAEGTNIQSWAVPGLGSQVRAWAFAHWGGKYFIFVSYTTSGGNVVNQVQRFDPKSGDTDIVIESTPYRIVGAGVSTCAPVISQ